MDMSRHKMTSRQIYCIFNDLLYLIISVPIHIMSHKSLIYIYNLHTLKMTFQFHVLVQKYILVIAYAQLYLIIKWHFQYGYREVKLPSSHFAYITFMLTMSSYVYCHDCLNKREKIMVSTLHLLRKCIYIQSAMS